MDSSDARLLRTAFLAGALSDAAAFLLMLVPRWAGTVWGLDDRSDAYRFAMRSGASLMLGWTVLLLWAFKRPLERRFVAALTLIVLSGLLLTEVAAVRAGVLATSRAVPTWSLQAILLTLFAGAYAGHARITRVLVHRRYLLSCGLLLLPIFVWNAVFTGHLPSPFTLREFWRDIPVPMAYAENALRWMISVLPFLMPLELRSASQRWGLVVIAVGTVLYFGAWATVMITPSSPWATSPVGFLAPAYTPLLWLVGVGLLGQRLYWGRWYRWWMFLVPAGGFILVHVSHSALVYARTLEVRAP